VISTFLALGFSLMAHSVTASAGVKQLSPPEPFSSRNHRNLSLLFLRMPMKGQPLAPGERELALGWTEANDFRVLPGLREDYEITRLEATGRWGWRNREELWAQAALMNRGGGFLDPWITGWHRDVLGWTDPNRDAAKNGEVVLQQDGRYSKRSAWGISDVTLGWTRSLGPTTSVSAAVKLPTGSASDFLGSGNVDLGVSIDHLHKFARSWWLHGQFGFIAQGRGSHLKGTRGWADQGALSLLWKPNSRDVWIAQWQTERAPVTTVAPGANATHRLLVLAYRRSVSARETLELWFSEDRDVFNGRWPEGANLGPDIAVGITWKRKF